MARNKDNTPGTQLEKVQVENQLQPGEMSTEEKRQRIRREATPPFRKKLDKIQHMLDGEARRSIKFRWELGLEIKTIYDDVTGHRGSTYGTNAIEEIAEYFDWDEGVVYSALRFAQQFTEEEIDELCEKRSPNGQPISFSHLMSLFNFDREKRKPLIDRAVAESWTAGQLARVAKEEKEKEEKERQRQEGHADNEEPEKSSKEDGRGRPIGKPRSFDAVAAQMEGFADDFMNRATLVWNNDEHGLFGKMSNLSTDDFTEERISKLKVLDGKLQQVEEMTPKLRKLVQYVRDILVSHQQSNKPDLKVVGVKEAPKKEKARKSGTEEAAANEGDGAE